MTHQQIIFSNDVSNAISQCLSNRHFNKVLVITDHNTRQHVLPLLADNPYIANAVNISIPAGDESKNLDSLTYVWKEMEAAGATRHSFVVNLGGGVITDLGGFAAATFKRGISFINVPTTLLSAVDAAVGGKTGINFMGLKNEIGTFKEASDVIISTAFFASLPQVELKSGYAEMIKHSLLKGDDAYRAIINFDITSGDFDSLLTLLKESVEVKAHIVKEDPQEKGIRRALNLGHTVGHAFESLALQQGKPIPHGYAVAWGMVVELILSKFNKGFDSQLIHNLAQYVRTHYGAFHITCDHYPELIRLMQHDKKSAAGEINCTLLSKPGEIHIDYIISPDEMQEALDIYRDLLGI